MDITGYIITLQLATGIFIRPVTLPAIFATGLARPGLFNLRQ